MTIFNKRGIGVDMFKKIIITVLLPLTFLVSIHAIAQSSGGKFNIAKSTIAGGGGTSSAGSFSITGTIGQPFANQQTSTGGGFSVAGGIWADAAIIDTIFKDGFESN